MMRQHYTKFEKAERWLYLQLVTVDNYDIL